MLRPFLYGLTLPLRAFAMIATSPTLIAWSVAPVAVTGMAYYLAITSAERWTHAAVETWLAAQGISPEGFLGGLASGLTWALLLFAGALTFSSAAAVLAVPFNDFLAEKAEPRARPPLAPCGSISMRRRAKLLVIDLLKALFGAALSLLAFAASWIPVLNLAAIPLAFLIVAFQFISYPQTRRGEGVGEAVRFISRNFALCLGFGAALTLLFGIPLLSFLMIPLAVVGGTQLYAVANGAKAAHRETHPSLR